MWNVQYCDAWKKTTRAINPAILPGPPEKPGGVLFRDRGGTDPRDRRKGTRSEAEPQAEERNHKHELIVHECAQQKNTKTKGAPMQEQKNKNIKKTPDGSSRNGQDLEADRASIRHKLKTVEGWQRDAFKRWKEQERKGQHESAARSKEAYNYCLKDAQRLRHILEGYDARQNGKNYFTKDLGARFRDKVTGRKV